MNIPLDIPVLSPVQIARQCYVKWKNPSFQRDLNHYMQHGFVIARSDIFLMGKVIDVPDKPDQALFIKMAVGNLRSLLCALPVLRPWISFYRFKAGGVARLYPLAELLKVIDKMIKRRETSHAPETMQA